MTLFQMFMKEVLWLIPEKRRNAHSLISPIAALLQKVATVRITLKSVCSYSVSDLPYAEVFSYIHR